MPTKLDPEKSIIPIFRGIVGKPTPEILGTEFIVGTTDNLKVITAKHVFENNSLEKGEGYLYLVQGDRHAFVD